MADTFVRTLVDSNNRKKPEELFFDRSINKTLNLNYSHQYSKVLEAVRLASSASNKQPWRIIKDKGNTYYLYMQENVSYNNSFKGIKLQNNDMGIAMCHFELAANELGLKGSWELLDPSVDGWQRCNGDG